jgi:transcriptional repressor NrdR
LKCPFCGHLDSKVIDSRLGAAGDVTRRRRECEDCGRRFTTYERVEEVLPLIVKKDGRREAFDRGKILGGLRRACEKRPVALERIEQVVDTIERGLMETGEKEVPSQLVGEKVMTELRGLDEIAYVRFASVYRRFEDIAELRAELERIERSRKSDPPALEAAPATPPREVPQA